MTRYVRFIVHQRIGGESRHLGLFSAAYYLRQDDDLSREDRDRLEQCLAWFETELTIPPRAVIPKRALFWYRDVGPFSDRMWEMANLLGDHGFAAEQITERFVGRVVYEDEHQLAALPPRRRRR